MSDLQPPDPEPSTDANTESVSAPVSDDGENTVDLDAIERDLDAAHVALDRLADGTYWTDDVTGEPIPDHVLDADPTARRAQ